MPPISMPPEALGEQQRTAFERDGCLVLRGWVPMSVTDSIRSEIVFVIRDQMAKAAMPLPDPATSIEDLIRMAFVPGSALREFLYHFLRHTPTLRQLMMSDLCVGVLKSLGFVLPVTAEIPSLRFDRAGEERFLTRPHQDLRSLRCDRAATIWVPLTSVNPEQGTALIYPGSHHAGLRPYEFVENQITVSDLSDLGTPQILSAEPGDLIVFNSLCVHGSMAARRPDGFRVNAQAFWNDAARIEHGSPYFQFDSIPDYKDLLLGSKV